MTSMAWPWMKMLVWSDRRMYFLGWEIRRCLDFTIHQLDIIFETMMIVTKIRFTNSMCVCVCVCIY